jgi:hypothetical protein
MNNPELSDEDYALKTEFAFASDGTVYIQLDDEEPPPGRRVFVGHALTDEERARIGTRALLAWAMLHTLALGSDGAVYVEAGALAADGRDVFRGYATTPEEAERLFDELHRAAFNITIAARQAGGRWATTKRK